MDIRQILREYDALFRNASPEEIHAFLAEHIRMAEEEGDLGALLTLLNEQVGYARDTDREEIVLRSGQRILDLLPEMGLQGTVPCGNSLLNVATAYRAYGHYEEAAALFPEVEKAFQNSLEEGAYEFAGLYNNWSLLHIERKNKEEAIRLIRKAIEVTDRYERAVIRQATSRGNLAVALLDLAKDVDPERARELREEARKALAEAAERHEAKGGQDYHYAAILSAAADMQTEEGRYEEAAENYQRAMDIIRMYMGENQKVEMLARKRKLALAAASGKAVQ